MWLLGIELRTSGRAGSALNHGAISPAHTLRFYISFPSISRKVSPYASLLCTPVATEQPVSIAVERLHDRDNSYKGKYLIRAGLQFRGLVHYQGRKHGSVQADTVLEEELRGLHPDLRQVAESLSLAWAFETSKPTPGDTLPPTRPHLLILSNSAAP